MNNRGFAIRSLLLSCIAFVCLSACQKLIPSSPADDELLDGPVEGLTTEESKRFLNGDISFNDRIFTAASGLGPVFVASSCGGCHAGDGKGHPFTALTRFGQTDSSGNKFLDRGGPQLQHRAIPGFEPETLPSGATFSKITAPAVTGLGFIELIPDTDILSRADPNDVNGDGISGIPNWIKPPHYTSIPSNRIPQNGYYIGRFGKKASTFDLLSQTVTAYNEDIGITSLFNPMDVWSGKETDPEITATELQDVVFYLQTLRTPVQRLPDDASVLEGKRIFKQINCETCHRESFVTGYSEIEALSGKNIYPYSDLLLHDMGPALDDGYTEGTALTSEWRTPLLWGLGLSSASQGGVMYLMHDGRARSIREAIEMHGGEAQQSKVKFEQLSEGEKENLLKFLESL